MRLYDLRTNSEKNPLGIDSGRIYFGWKIESERQNTMQRCCCVEMSYDAAFSEKIWDSGMKATEESVYFIYTGEPLCAMTRYYWRVTVEDNHGETAVSSTAWFETGLKGNTREVWDGAEWIGSPIRTMNTDSLTQYAVRTEFRITRGNATALVFGARDKDNYLALEYDSGQKKLFVREYGDGAWEDGTPVITALGRKDGFPVCIREDWQQISMEVEGTCLTVVFNGERVIDMEDILPRNISFCPRKEGMRNIGIRQLTGSADYRDFSVSNTADGVEYRRYDSLTVTEEFRLFCAVSAVCVKRHFQVEKKLVSARLYCTAMGFYDVFINGKKANEGFFNPGFTDYRKRIPYQSYDVTGQLRQGANVLGAVVTKGYFTGYVGYSAFPMVYGRKNAFLGKLVLTFEDKSSETIVTDENWQFTDEGPVVNADYQQGEIYDARKEIDWNDMEDVRFGRCGIIPWPKYAVATNGTLAKEPFLVTAQEGPQAVIERVLKPTAPYKEMPEGHFVYDLGQNMVGTVRLKFKGRAGTGIKIRYGEMCYPDGRIYVANLRNAANTDCYTLRGAEAGAPGKEDKAAGSAGDAKKAGSRESAENTECFVPTGTCHGFRYIEISGDGCRLTAEEFEKLVVGVEGLVLTNTVEPAGDFTCSNNDINRLQSNIKWGQRGNSLLVYTDCPQRNERMGWTGDAQVFAATAACNMNIKTFMEKWLTDLRDAQLLYNRDGAVPDTAPLGGDNRPMGGCGGWGDAAVIVPWEMYRAYGDMDILKKNYEMMRAWVDYQSRADRQYSGIRTVDGDEVFGQSDISEEPYIQIQQSRGDHLAPDCSTPFIYSATAYAAHSAEILWRTAELLGKNEDAKKYRLRYEKVRKAFCEAWFSKDGSLAYWGEMSKAEQDSYGNIINKTRYFDGPDKTKRPSQTAYALALDFGLLPEEKRKKAAQGLAQSFRDRDGKLSVGFLGISHLAPALCKAGHPEMAFELLEQTEYPGWLYSVKNGATTIWERWNSYIAETESFGDVSMNSFNHYAYGAIGEWLFGGIAGIGTGDKPGEAGYKRILLTPAVGGSLKYAEAWHECGYGKIVSGWKLEDGRLHYHCTVPANTTALLYLPSKNGIVKKELGSGSYEFASDWD